MPILLVATTSGCRVFHQADEAAPELAGHSVGPLARAAGATCLAIVDESEIWRRTPDGVWTHFATAPIPLQSIAICNSIIFAGGRDEAALLRIAPDGRIDRLIAFDNTPGREAWIANGPPLGVRSIAAMPQTVLAAVHVGGIPRSIDHGESWMPTIPVLHDVHEVSVHPSTPNIVAAATAVGLCISYDSGATWTVHTEGLSITNSLAVAVLEQQVLFSIQESPFAAASQLWRWPLGSSCAEPVRDGLPKFLEGKIDTGCIATGSGCAAVIDKAGNLWRSNSGSTGWQQIATIPPYVSGLLFL